MLFVMGKIPVPGIYPALGSPNAGYHSHQFSSSLLQPPLHVLNIHIHLCVCLRFEGSRMIQVMLLKSLLQVNSVQSSWCTPQIVHRFSQVFSFGLITSPYLSTYLQNVLLNQLPFCQTVFLPNYLCTELPIQLPTYGIF